MERMRYVKTRQRCSLAAVAIAVVLASGSLASCTKSETEPGTGLPAPIVVNASVQATVQTKAPVAGTQFAASTSNVFRLTAFAGAAAPASWASPYFYDVQVNSGVASALTLGTTQYYPTNGNKVYFYAYAPQATSLTAGTGAAAPIANYTLTGQEDIMAAQATTGIAKAATGTQSQPALNFTHKLMQLRFKIVKDASYEAGKKVTEVLVKNVRNSAKLSLSNGALTFDDTADKTLKLPLTAGTNDEITTAGTTMSGSVMCEPAGASGTVRLKVTADGAVYDNIEVTLTGTNNGQAGTSHLITLTFKRTGITPTATITPWATPVNKDADVDGDESVAAPAVGDYYYADGSYSTGLQSGKAVNGVIFYIDPADPLRYKVMSLEESSGNLKWAPKNTYVVGAAAASYTDGKANTAAIRKYSADHTADASANTKTTGIFATDFPAAEYCYNHTGKAKTDAPDTWYLPAIYELEYLYCAFNGAAPVTWQDTSNAPTTILNARNAWNKLLTDAGGNTLSIGDRFLLFASSESNVTAQILFFTTGGVSTSNKYDGRIVRCIRDVAPPTAIGDLRDGGIVYWVNPANPTKYKVFSLEQGVLKSLGKDTYELGAGDGRNQQDGRLNVSAMKAYSAANINNSDITKRTTGVFATDFPAAEFCDRKGNGWYLPAVNELDELMKSTNVAHKSIINDALQKNSGTAFPTASANFWTATDPGFTTGYIYFIDNSSNAMGSRYYMLGSNSNYVRCIREQR